MNLRGKKVDGEMLVTHPRAEQKSMAGRDERNRSAGPTTERKDRTGLKAELAAATTAEDRRAIIVSIQERFGNEVAEEVIREVRWAHPLGEEKK